jgi:secreted PhoX family phosphatase
MAVNRDDIIDNSGDEPLSNHSDNPTFASILEADIGRRSLLKGGVGAAMIGMLAAPLAGCKIDLGELTFEPIPVGRDDTVAVPPGYSAKPFLPWGTPITGSYPPYKDGGLNTGAEQEQQMGMNHDGIHFFPIDCRKGGSASHHGLLVMNHEYIEPHQLHPNGPTVVAGVRTIADEVRKEVAAHGVSIVEIRNKRGQWEVVKSPLNRRITGATPMEIGGPARGHAKMRTKYSPDGTRTRGTLNNCAHGYTPWNTYLTCEENWAGYFVNKDASRPREHSRFGVPSSASRYRWETVTDQDVYARFNASSLGASATEDYRNEPNTFGWVVEIDPFDPNSVPVKRTALGRFAHEGVIFQEAKEGKPLVCYSGDDAQNEYIYKFISKAKYNKKKAGGWMLDEGTLYAARFDADGSGKWLALDINDPDFQAACLQKGVVFTDQADVLINTRLAADTVGATKMDRPEWGAVHPFTGEVYFALTNNSGRTPAQVDAANPRGPNPYGHIIRFRESDKWGAGTTFSWDIFLLSGPQGDSSNLDENSIHASPDGLWFDQRGVLWIQTDMSGSQETSGPFGNNQMLAVNPNDPSDIRRFLVGPPLCEVTGIITTPNGRTAFVNIQHPDGTSHWPDGGNARPRSATVIITRDDGGIIAG